MRDGFYKELILRMVFQLMLPIILFSLFLRYVVGIEFTP